MHFIQIRGLCVRGPIGSYDLASWTENGNKAYIRLQHDGDCSVRVQAMYCGQPLGSDRVIGPIPGDLLSDELGSRNRLEFEEHLQEACEELAVSLDAVSGSVLR